MVSDASWRLREEGVEEGVLAWDLLFPLTADSRSSMEISLSDAIYDPDLLRPSRRDCMLWTALVPFDVLRPL